MPTLAEDRKREKAIRRRAALRGLGIAATGFVLPALVMWTVWLTLWILDVGPMARVRLGLVLRPTMSELPGILLTTLILAMPFIVQGIVASRVLVSRGKQRQRAEWRAAGCFVGLCVSTIVVFGAVAPNMQMWTGPGHSISFWVIVVHYAGAVFAGLVGRAVGLAVGRKHFRKQRQAAPPEPD